MRDWSQWADSPAKSRLATFGQGRGKESKLIGAPEIVLKLIGHMSVPKYTHTRSGPAHDFWFTARCHVRCDIIDFAFDSTQSGIMGRDSRTLKDAEESAAQAVIDQLVSLLGCPPSASPAPPLIPNSTAGDVQSISLLTEYAAIEFKPNVQCEPLICVGVVGQIGWRAKYVIDANGSTAVHCGWGVGVDKNTAKLAAAVIAENEMKPKFKPHYLPAHDRMIATQRLHQLCTLLYKPVAICAEDDQPLAAGFTMHFELGNIKYPAATEPSKAAARQSAARNALDKVPNQTLVAELRERRRTATLLPMLVSTPSTVTAEVSSDTDTLSHHIVQAVEKQVHETWEATRLSGSSLPPPGAAVIGAIVQSTERAGLMSELVVVAMGTGSKYLSSQFISTSGASFDGSRVVDSHAEILTCRVFKLYLVQQLEAARSMHSSGTAVAQTQPSSCFDATGKLREGVSFHLYITTAPCGDARRFNSSSSAEGEPTKRRRIESDSSQHAPDISSLEMGKRTTKIADGMTGSPTDSKDIDPKRRHAMSCSDKVLKWGVLGLQGRILRAVLPQSVMLSSVVIGSDFNKSQIERALCCRHTSKHGACNQLSIVHEPLPVATSSVSKPNVGRYSTSLNWFAGSALGTIAEVTDGSSGRCTDKSRSRLCKWELMTRFLSLDGMPAPITGESYLAFKKRVTSADVADQVKQATRDINGSPWVHLCHKFDFPLNFFGDRTNET